MYTMVPPLTNAWPDKDYRIDILWLHKDNIIYYFWSDTVYITQGLF